MPRVSVLVIPHRFADRELKRSWKRPTSIRPTSIYEVSPCKVILVRCRRWRYRRAIRCSYIYLLTSVGQLYATNLSQANQAPRSVLCNSIIRHLALCHLEKGMNTSRYVTRSTRRPIDPLQGLLQGRNTSEELFCHTSKLLTAEPTHPFRTTAVSIPLQALHRSSALLGKPH